MALADHEKRELDEIEQRLFDDDPKFAAKLTKPSVLVFLSRKTLLVLGVIAVYLGALLAVVAGVTWSSVALVVLGALLGTGVFAGLIVLAWRGRRK
ncbi:DUF3040 domain-containing protein [Lentzea sp. NPDC060358]|uniref:DUF3040 domain-containing protein n=1 Tax=Lentzea sp. NPDC060358 TaxID=3347103 RepID=UPI003648E4C0